MTNDLALILREILSQADSMGAKPASRRAAIRRKLLEKGVSEHLISDALFLLDVIEDCAREKKEKSKPVRVLASEEMDGLSSAVVGKLFRLYYLGYMNKEDMESVMTRLLFVPGDLQEERARESVAGILGITRAQAEFIFDGGLDSVVVH